MEETINKRICDFTKTIDMVQTVLIFLIAFLVPTFLGKLIVAMFGAESVAASNSQIIIGSIVNTALIIAALNLKGWSKTIGVVTMPSVSTILSGYVFKTASVYMAYMIPAIWLGNFALVYAYKLIMLKYNKNYFMAGIIGILTKVTIIAGSFVLLRTLGVFPQKLITNLQTAMSTVQLITASIGCIIAYLIYFVENKLAKNTLK